MKKILIIEDDKTEVEALINVIKRVNSDSKIMTADNIGNAFQYAVEHNISLFIVDIILEPQKKSDVSGMEFVETIRNLPQYKYVPIIFITSLDDSRLYAYENLHCFRYIQKPLLYSEVETVIEDALNYNVLVKSEAPLKIKQDGVIYVIQKKDILYAYSKAAKMKIITKKEEYDFYYLTCSMLLDMLKSDCFIKCNRNTIVNQSYIISIDQRNNLIEMDGCSDEIKIGKGFKKEFIRGFCEND